MSLNGATIAFDLDGTLVDTAPDLIGALNIVLQEQGLPALPVAAARMLVGRGARRLIERGFEVAGEPLDEARVGGLVTRFIEVYRGRIASESRPFPGLVECLDALESAGARLCVCTNKRTDLSRALLDALGLTPRFGAVVGPDAAGAQKPDPAHLAFAVRAAGGEPARCLMVGDSANDVAAAHALPAPCVLMSFGYTEVPARDLGAELVLDRFADLPAAAHRLLDRLPVL